MNWVDTETKAILRRCEEPPLAPPKVAEFALVLGYKGVDQELLIRAVCRINDCSTAAAAALVRQPSPLVVNLDLTEEDALLGQFELVCCGAVSAMVRSEVAGETDRQYLQDLLTRISRSPEFEPTTVCVESVPSNEAGRRFVDQFLGLELPRLAALGFPRRFTMAAKKARIMKHWALRVGARVEDDKAEPGARPSGGPAAPNNSGTKEGPPSVS